MKKLTLLCFLSLSSSDTYLTSIYFISPHWYLPGMYVCIYVCMCVCVYLLVTDRRTNEMLMKSMYIVLSTNVMMIDISIVIWKQIAFVVANFRVAMKI